VYWSLAGAIFAVITIYLRRKERITLIAVKDQVGFLPMKNTSAVAVVLDPRVNVGNDNLNR
jgi:hypothetical protein